MMELAEALDTTGVVRGEWKGENWRELLEKRPGANASLYLAEGRAGQMKLDQTPYRTRRAANEVTGVVKLDGIVHRYCTFLTGVNDNDCLHPAV